MTQSPLPVRLSEEAQADLDETVVYLSGEAGDSVALRYLAAVEDTARLLSEFPHIGTHCPFKRPPLSSLRRKQVMGKFASWTLFYYVATDRIEVARILHGKQNWLTLLR